MIRSKVFISYSHQDAKILKRLQEQLAVLERQGLISQFDDQQIGAGAVWFERLNEEMLAAHVALLLISPSFLSSDFINREEVPRLFGQHSKGGMEIYPLLIRDCPWQEVPWLARLQLRPKDAQPVASKRGAALDKCLADVAREIAAIAKAAPKLDTPQGRARVYDDFDKRLDKMPADQQLKQREFFNTKWLTTYGLTVSDLKQMLASLDYYKGEINDAFDREIAAAIVYFQKDNGLSPADGICGEMCITKLKTLLG